MKDILTIQQKRDIPFQVKYDGINNHKEVNMSERTVDLIANTYNWFDTDFDVLLPGCSNKSIIERGPNSNMPGKIKHAWFHDLRELHAIPKLIEETKYKNMDVLRANSFFPENDKSEQELLKYKQDFYDQHSIGFLYMVLTFMESETKDFEDILPTLINPQDAIDAGFLYAVSEIKLFEYSTVAFGSNKLTPYLGSKSKNKTIQYNNMVAKLDALQEAFKKGGDKDIIEMQYRQLKQMIYEQYNQEPSIKDTLRKPSEKDTFDSIEYINTLNI